ncbi:MAG TPA: iron-containing alcohol dehydrogenase [Geminicoccaceae bacterium]
MDQLIVGLRDGRLPDPDGGGGVPLPVTRIVVEASLDGQEADLLAPLRLPRPWLVVSDEITREVLGRRVERALAAGGVVLERPKAGLETAGSLAERARGAGALIAVGSGTLNDLVKHAAASTGRPYVVFATAPSMNGYVTGTASLAVGGLKSTLPARAPRAALFELEVLTRAPARLIRAGLGDTLCRTTAEADWLLAHLVTGSAYDPRPFRLQAADEPKLLDSAGRLAEGDPEAVLTLTRLLILSGLGMALAGSSAPASQGEHLISHVLDMWDSGAGRLHGEQVGVATLTMSRLQHRLLDLVEAPLLRAEDGSDPARLTARFDPALRDACARALAAKALAPEGRRALARRLAEDWGMIRGRLAPAMVRTGRLTAALEAAGAACRPEDLGIEPAVYGAAVRHARAIRDRYTALDFAAAAGMLDAFVREETAR